MILIYCKLILLIFIYRAGEPEKVVVAEKDRILQEKEAELRRMQEMLTAMKAQMQQQQP